MQDFHRFSTDIPKLQEPFSSRPIRLRLTFSLTNEKTKERGEICPRPDSSLRQIKDGEARLPVSADPERDLGNRLPTVTHMGALRIVGALQIPHLGPIGVAPELWLL